MSPIASAYITPQTPSLAAPQPPLTNGGDWCSGLVYVAPSSLAPGAQASEVLKHLQFTSAPLNFVSGTVTFTPSTDPGKQSYSILTQVSSTLQLTHFSRVCLQAFGAHPTCADLSGILNSQVAVNYNSVTCSVAADQGCDCTYLLGDSSSDTGIWRAQGSTILEFSSSSGHPPQAVDFCVKGNTMTLSGKDGSHLIGSANQRSMVVTKVTESDAGM